MTYLDMGQTRNDTYEQIAAKQDGALRRQCPKCLRKNALSSRVILDDAWSVRQCRYCGHAVGSVDGKSFGR